MQYQTKSSQDGALFELEEQFWQAIADEDVDAALGLLVEPALMVSSHGVHKFDHAGYRRAAQEGSMVLKSYELREMDATFPNDDTAILTYKVKQIMSPRGKPQEIEQDMADTSTWIREQGKWQCVMHTETPVEGTTGNNRNAELAHGSSAKKRNAPKKTGNSASVAGK